MVKHKTLKRTPGPVRMTSANISEPVVRPGPGYFIDRRQPGLILELRTAPGGQLIFYRAWFGGRLVRPGDLLALSVGRLILTGGRLAGGKKPPLLGGQGLGLSRRGCVGCA